MVGCPAAAGETCRLGPLLNGGEHALWDCRVLRVWDSRGQWLWQHETSRVNDGRKTSTQRRGNREAVPGEIGDLQDRAARLERFSERIPGASALAILAIKAPSLELCWQFSQLKNVTAPTRARIYRSLAGGPGVGGLGVVLGAGYTPEGCDREPEGFLALLGKVPQNFFLSIDNAAFPHGAVRGRP